MDSHQHPVGRERGDDGRWVLQQPWDSPPCHPQPSLPSRCHPTPPCCHPTAILQPSQAPQELRPAALPRVAAGRSGAFPCRKEPGMEAEQPPFVRSWRAVGAAALCSALGWNPCGTKEGRTEVRHRGRLRCWGRAVGLQNDPGVRTSPEPQGCHLSVLENTELGTLSSEQPQRRTGTAGQARAGAGGFGLQWCSVQRY